MWIRKALILMSVVASSVVMPARPALACSCMPIDAASTLGEVPAAFVGTVVDVSNAENPREFEEVVFTFRVDEWIKGDLGDTVEMRSSSSGASCGFEMGPGQQSGIIVRDAAGPLSGGLCDRVDAGVLRLAAAPIPAPTGSGALSLLVAGSFGGSGLIALNSDGDVLGYGPHPTDDAFYFPRISVCPGARTVVELVGDDSIYVRDLATLQVVSEGRVDAPQPESGYTYFNSLACRNEDATDLLVFGISEVFGEEGDLSEEEYFDAQTGVVYRLGPGGFEPFYAGAFGGEGPEVLIGPDTAVAPSGFRDPKLIALDLNTAETRELYRYERTTGAEDAPFVEGMAMSPSGGFVATLDANFVRGGVDYYLTVFDLEADEPVVGRAKMLEFGQIVWVDDGTIAYVLNFHLHDEEGGEVAAEKSGTVQLFRASDLELVGEWAGWTADGPVVIDGRLYGVTHPGSTLVSAPAASGPVVELRGFPGSVQGLIAVPDGPVIDPEAAAPSQRQTETTVPPATLGPDSDPGTTSREGSDIAGTTADPGRAAPLSDSGRGSPARIVIGVVVLVVLFAGGWLVLRSRRRLES